MLDDEADFLSVVRLWASPDYDFVGAANGENILAKIADLKPSLVVLDIHLPGTNGFEICRDIRGDGRFGDLPILFLTGSREDEDYLKNMKVGGTAYLSKPVGRKQLLSAFHDLVAGADETVDTPAGD